MSELNDKNLTESLFHYKLNSKTKEIIKDEILTNHGEIGSKTMLDLHNKKAKNS